ncbi:MAG: Ig-like domain-containing protein [Candidatus Methanomethylophilaceae archaeon]|nr:Ig-like domain-containing protein [Candidatus Methanomethylophilaceae archaeon]
MNMKIVAVAVVAVVLVAGIGAFLVLQNGGDKEQTGKSDGRLQVYGNANNDDYLDSKDVDLVKDIAEGESSADSSKRIDWKSLYPYADADNDGKVDSKDVELTQALADRKSGTTVYYLDGTGAVKSVEYPIKSICVLGTATFTAVQSLGLSDMVQGRSGTSQTNDVIYKDIWAKPAVSATMVEFDISMFSNVADKVSGGIDAIIQNNGGMGAPIDETEAAELEKLGTATVTMKFDVRGEENYYLTLGFLCAADDRAHQVVGMMDDVYKTADDAVTAAGKKPSVLCCWVTGSMGTGFYASSQNSVAAFVTAAGGDLIEIPEGSMDISSDAVGILDDRYDGDYILAPVRTSVSYLDAKDDWKTPWESVTGGSSALSQMEACPDRTFLFMYGMPFICKVAYAVEVLYPDQVKSGYGDGVNQSWVELCYIQNLGSDYKVADHGFCIGKKDFGGQTAPVVAATSISMFEDSVSMAVGETKLLSYTTTPAGSKASGSTAWKSSDASVATVDAGTVKAVSPGTAVITLTIGSLSAQCTVTVKDDSVKDYSETVTGVGADAIASAFATNYDGPFGKYSMDSGATSERASVSAKSGSRTMTIVFEGNTQAASMFADAVSDGGIEKPLGMPGESVAEVSYQGAFDGFYGYKHEASSMARFTALNFVAYSGNILVDAYSSLQYRMNDLASADEVSAILDAVAQAVTGTTGGQGGEQPAKLNLSDSSITVMAGDSAEIQAVLEPAGSGTVTWSSSDESVAVVSDGTVTGIAYGTAVITASAGALSADCKVTVMSSTAYDAGADFVASAFASAYVSGGFGTYAVEDGSSGVSAMMSDGSHYFLVMGDSDPSALFDRLSDAVAAKPDPYGNGAKTALDLSGYGFDEAAGCYYKVSMGGTMTWMYFAVAKGNIVVDGTLKIQSCRSEPTSELFDGFFKTLSGAMGLQTAKSVGADDKASAFVSAYAGSSTFGTLSVAEGGTDPYAVARFDTGSRVAPLTDVVFIGCTDASDRFSDAKSAIDAEIGDMGMPSKDVSASQPFDGFYGKIVDMAMGSMSFSMFYFATYEGDVFVDGYSAYQLHRGSLATEEDMNSFVVALASSMGVS